MIDFLLDTDGDILLASGDLVASEATVQHQRLLLLIEKGELREFPVRGLGISSWVLDETSSGSLNAAVKREFEGDGMIVRRVNVRQGALQIDAYYE